MREPSRAAPTTPRTAAWLDYVVPDVVADVTRTAEAPSAKLILQALAPHGIRAAVTLRTRNDADDDYIWIVDVSIPRKRHYEIFAPKPAGGLRG